MALNSSASGDHSTWKVYESMRDIVTPSYKKLSARGRIINNPLEHVTVHETSPFINYSASWDQLNLGCTPQRWFPSLSCEQTGTKPLILRTTLLDVPEVNVSHLCQLALTKAWASIGTNEMLGGSALMEVDDAIVGMAYILKKVFRILRSLATANFRSLKKELTPQDLADIYMNARYSLRPLVYDTGALIRILCNPTREAKRQTFRAFAADSEMVSDQVQIGPGTGAFDATVVRSAVRTVEVRAGVN
jgi:hypothetical protein